MLIAALLLDVTVRLMVEEMVDLDRLTRPANYVCRQFSSYDRGSHDPDNWFANADCGNYLRQEEGAFVLAEAEGPGAIVRIWSANPAGTLRIYLDGSVALEEDFKALLSGEVAAFPPPFGAMRSRGGNLYYPFPYARSMKVTCSEGSQYYHVNCRTYAPGTRVETWSRDRAPPLPELRAAPAGELTTARALVGPGIVRRLEIDLPQDPQELRAKLLRIQADGELCVCCPLGDFFGSAPGVNAHETLPIGMTADGVGYCTFPMPYARTLEIDVDAEVRLWTESGERPLRFFAWWRGANALATRPMSDWPVLHAAGAGRLVGCALAVRNPVKAWWGEGDEKIYVDGEEFPSTFGTGTEDYFGYAWCNTALFQAPYHSQSRADGPANFGYCAVSRFHVLDDVPFTESLRFDLEVWHWAETSMGYSTVAYWYAAPGAAHDFTPPGLEERAVLPLPEFVGVKGAIEGESFTVAALSAGIAEPQDLGFAEGFSRESHLWWRDAAPGDELRLRFVSPVGGSRRLVLCLTRAPDYGVVRIAVNGQLLAEEIDLYAEGVVPDEERVFEDVPLLAGENEMVVTITGTNEQAEPKNYMFGLDYVRVPE